MKDNRDFVLNPEKVNDFLSQSKHNAKKALERFYAHQPKEGVIVPHKFYNTIKHGSKFFIGKNRKTILTVDQHFNWFQKLMWKWCFGVKIEDYSEE